MLLMAAALREQRTFNLGAWLLMGTFGMQGSSLFLRGLVFLAQRIALALVLWMFKRTRALISRPRLLMLGVQRIHRKRS